MEKEFKNIFGFKIYLDFKCANPDTFDDVITKVWCLLKFYIVFKRLVASSAAIHNHEVRKWMEFMNHEILDQKSPADE